MHEKFSFKRLVKSIFTEVEIEKVHQFKIPWNLYGDIAGSHNLAKIRTTSDDTNINCQILLVSVLFKSRKEKVLKVALKKLPGYGEIDF